MDRILSLAMNPALDISAKVEHVIAEGKLFCHFPQLEPGGGGVNVSRTIKKLGGESILLYTAGGYTGNMLKDLLSKEEIDHKPISIQGMTRESFVILEQSSGQQYRFGMLGPMLKKEEWKLCLEELTMIQPVPEYLVISGSLPSGVPSDFYVLAARVGKKKGTKVIIDASGEPLRQAFTQGVFLIKPNYREFREVVGEDSIAEEPRIGEQALQIVKRGQCEIMVISLGAGGALLVTKDIIEHIHSPTVPISSKVGAGDSLVAGIVLGLARGQSIRQSVIFGVAAGAAAVFNFSILVLTY